MLRNVHIFPDISTKTAKSIAKQEYDFEGDIPKYVIDAVLSEKCSNGKSFLEIEQKITVTVIY